MKVLESMLSVAVLGAAALVVAHSATSQARAEGTAAAGSATVALHVEGMTCPSCKVAVRTALSRLAGVKDARVDVARKSATVDYDPARVTPPQMVDAVNRLGYEASLPAKSGS
jgi:periplasmic mercuric ion binding protein